MHNQINSDLIMHYINTLHKYYKIKSPGASECLNAINLKTTQWIYIQFSLMDEEIHEEGLRVQ